MRSIFRLEYMLYTSHVGIEITPNKVQTRRLLEEIQKLALAQTADVLLAVIVVLLCLRSYGCSSQVVLTVCVVVKSQ